MRRKHVTAAVILIGFGGWYGYQTALLPTRTLPHAPSPAFFPGLLTLCLLVLAILLFVQGLRDVNAGVWLAEHPASLAKPAAGLLLLVGYVAALPQLGFVVASIPFFAVLTRLSGERRWLWIVAPSIVIPLVLFGLFRYVFRILLPQADFWSAMWSA